MVILHVVCLDVQPRRRLIILAKLKEVMDDVLTGDYQNLKEWREQEYYT